MNDNLICLAGPTGSGKSDLAVALCQRLGGEIVSCDSMQIYRGMDVGTAKPTPAQMGGIRHHLLDVAEPGEDFSVSRYVELATAAIEDIHARGKLAVVCGGTGLYMDSLIRGTDFAPPAGQGERALLERTAEQKGIGFVYDMLREADPETAERLHLSDRKRIIRAMEVFLVTGLPLSYYNEQSRLQAPRYTPLWLALGFHDRAALYARIDRRVERMMEQGLEQEVRSLLGRGLDPKTTALQAIGYKEMVGALRGECSLDEAVRQIQQSSRRYAKRQLTWLRRNENIHWLYVDESPDLPAEAMAIIQNPQEKENPQ